MKKQYKVVDMSTEEVTESASENTAGGGSAVVVPLLKIDGDNEKLLDGGVFELPKASECEDELLEVAYRICGFVVTKENLAHLPASFTADHIVCLSSFYPFAYHKRMGPTWSDRVCPESTRTCKCTACTGRKEMFTSDEYKNGKIRKKAILGGGFGTRQVGVFVAKVLLDGVDHGFCAVPTALTNPKSTTAKHDNFFDMVGLLTNVKKRMAGDTLPKDYYANGDGARWIIAEYTRDLYMAKDDDGNERKGGKAHPFWKLSKLTPKEEIPGAGKASDIWWPKVDKKDGAMLFDVYSLINHTDTAVFDEIVEGSIQKIMTPRKRRTAETNEPEAGGCCLLVKQMHLC